MVKPVWTTEQIAAQLTRDRAAWDASEPIAYAYYEQPAPHLGQVPNFTAFTAAQRQALAGIFDLISDLVPLTFANVADNGQEPGPGNERIGYFNLNRSTAPFWGTASNSQTAPNGDQLGLISGADIVVNRYRADAQGEWDPGDSNVRKLTHETLHALGLAHPGDYNGDGAIDYENEAEYEQDSVQYTVMSYWDASNTGAVHSAGGITSFAATPLLHDVAALQALYGANPATRTGDTVYGFNSTAGRPAYDIAQNPLPVFTIWDAAGIDTLDLSGFATASRIDLGEGAFTDAGGLTRNISIAFGATIENAVGGAGDDVLVGNAAGNRLDGGAGADAMRGREGDDVYIVDQVGDQPVEFDVDSGIDSVLSSVSFALGPRLEFLQLVGNATYATGNDLANQLTGNAAANVLDGRTGADVMAGRGGDDIYMVDHEGDAVIETWAFEGNDTVHATVSFSLWDHVENLVLLAGPAGAAAIDATGNWYDNRLTGNAAANRLDGGAGADRLEGGMGNDTYVVDQVGDQVVETAAGGTDSVQSSVGFTLGANVENLILTGASAVNATGNALANALTGNGAANVLSGGGGADAMKGGLGNDVYFVDNAGDAVSEAANAGTDRVESSVAYTLAANVENLALTGAGAINGTGNALANGLAGNAGANRLDGGGGGDVMAGGLGYDIYVANHEGDQVIESDPAGGRDTVLSAVSFTLGANVENLTLTGALKLDGTGNALANSLTGNGATNKLNGAGGADRMEGMGGDDLYFIDDAGDRVIETDPAGGLDTVHSAVAFALVSNVENLVLTGSAAIDGTGNTLANSLTGNGAANRLNGGGGGDAMRGLGGDDIYVVNDALDKVVESSAAGGRDKVESSIGYTLGAYVEDLALIGNAALAGTGNALANALTGNGGSNRLKGEAGADTLDGGGGADRLHGGLGHDVLKGGAGADGFFFDTAPGASNVDSLADFNPADDIVQLSRAVFAAITANGTLNPAAFHAGPAAADPADRILHDAATGRISYDADGSGAGAAILFATLAPGTVLTHLDFVAY